MDNVDKMVLQTWQQEARLSTSSAIATGQREFLAKESQNLWHDMQDCDQRWHYKGVVEVPKEYE